MSKELDEVALAVARAASMEMTADLITMGDHVDFSILDLAAIKVRMGRLKGMGDMQLREELAPFRLSAVVIGALLKGETRP